jgi:UDP-N-acetylmuramate dehydrogenase
MPYFQREQRGAAQLLFYVLNPLVYNEPMDPTGISNLFEKAVGKPALLSVSLKAYSHFCIGGPADLFFEATREQELVSAVRFAQTNDIPFRVIGGGTNLLFDDSGFRGLILRNAVKGFRLITGTSGVAVSSGSTLEELITFCVEQEIGGLEFLVGIPGTLGGAVYGNAGAFDTDIGRVLTEARLLTRSGEITRVDQAFFSFAYRTSSLKSSGHILLEVVLEGHPQKRGAIQAALSEFRKKRENRHPPWEVACAGSYFKNPVLPSGEKVPAAFLLDQVGAKGMRVGGAEVYSGHANFIINRGSAGSKEVQELAERLKKEVKARFEVELEEEVIYLPADR